MNNTTDLPNRLRELRGARSRRKMAKELAAAGLRDCTGPRIYDWESGRTRVPADALRFYAVACGLSADEQLALAGMPAAGAEAA